MSDTTVQWLAGWYVTRLHAYVGPGTLNPREELDAVCGHGVFLKPRTGWAERKLASGGVPRCKLCERLLAKSGGSK